MITLSSDSSCLIHSSFGQLENMNFSNNPNEMFHLQSSTKDESSWDHQHNYCNLPEDLYGEFEYLTIDGDQVIFRDSVSFKIYTMKCLELYKDIKYHGGQKHDNNTKILTLSRTQCGKSFVYIQVCIIIWKPYRLHVERTKINFEIKL